MTTQLAPLPVFKAWDNAGVPLNGGKLFTYVAGTATKQASYTDSTGSTPNTNPVILNYRGEANVWLDPTKAYKVVLAPANDTDPPTNPFWTVDQISGGQLSPSGSIIPSVNNLFNLGSTSFSWANAYFGANGLALIDAGGNAGFYARTAAEIAAAITPADYFFAPGNVLRYGAVGNGVIDDSTAVTNALLVAAQPAGHVVLFPAGYTFKITSYIQIFSNTEIQLLGTLQLTNRNSGLFGNGATNIGINGFNKGSIIDSTVSGNYIWNNNNFNLAVPVAPAIHLRSCLNCLIEGVIISFVNQGILFSNATTNTLQIGSIVLTQPLPVNCRAVSCNMQFCEMTGISSYNCQDCAYLTNYVYRCGDGGMSMFTGTDCDISGNHRISPYSVPADVTTFGANNQAHPTTWNDEQGIELEACHGTIVTGNVVQGFWGFGIDIKNGCNRILVSNNRVVDTESCSIIVREGDGIKNACHKVSIIGNTISGHGYLQRTAPTSQQGAIRVGECFITEIIANVIYAYQTTVGISCLGPGAYQASYYPSDPHQGSLVVTNNCFDFKNSSFETESEIGYTSATLSAIVINGQYDSVLCDGNKITADRYLSADARTPSAPAISLTYVSANSTFYPNIASISDNIIDDGWNGGIIVTGLTGWAQSGLKVNDNAIGGLYAGNFIQLNATHFASVSGNVLSQVGAGGQAGIQITGTGGNLVNGCVVNDNSIGGGISTAAGMGTNSMTFGVSFAFCNNCTCMGNRISLPASGNVQTTSCTGDIITTGTTGFPRTNAGTPNGVLTSFYFGETAWDSTNSKWWAASAAQSTTWTQLTN